MSICRARLCKHLWCANASNVPANRYVFRSRLNCSE